MTERNNELVQIKQLGKKHFIFNAQDVERLRREYRIAGSLSGTLPQFPLQNTFYGLPLLLLPEEVHLLLDRGWAEIIAKNIPNTTTSSSSNNNNHNLVFEHFWSKGFYVTSGIKFGGDYLLYPGDPMSVHSEYIVSVYDCGQRILPIDFISMGRLATNVKKTFVIATVITEEEEKEEHDDKYIKEVTCYSIKWAGF